MLIRTWAVLVMLSLVEPLAKSSIGAAEPTADPRRPAAIATEGVPLVPDELFEKLRQYQNTRTAVFLGWSPDGRGMLVQTRFGNSMQVHRVYEPGGRREQMTFFDEPVIGSFVPKTADGELLLSMSRGGNENDQISYLNPGQNVMRLLTDGTSRNILGPIRDDGGLAVVASNQRNGRDTDLYTCDCRQPGSMQLLLQATGDFWEAHDWSSDGGRVLVTRYVSINEAWPALVDVATKARTDLAVPGGGPAAYSSLAFAPDGKFAYVASDARGEFLELARVELATGEHQWLTNDLPWDVTHVEVYDASGAVAFAINEDGASKLFVLQRDERQALPLPLGVLDGLEFSPGGDPLGFTLVQGSAPADAWSVDIAEGKLTRWTYSETGGLNPANFVQPQAVRFSSFDGRQIPAYLFLPPTASRDAPAPVLIDIHGGPESQYRPTFSGQGQFYVNELGLAVMHPNVRGSAGYGKTYLKLDNAELREDSVRDIGALLDWIAERPDLDESRVAVNGGSYGGYMVLGSLVNYPQRIKAGVDIVGIANFITFLENTSPYRQDLRRAEYGDERKPEIREFFERINPTSRIDHIQSALLVAHGVNDPRVPFSEAQQIADMVRASGRDVWTLYAENEGHGFAKKDNRDYMYAVVAMFLAEHLSRR